jgi:Fe2+ or Zn2+ uptake regulation protein
MPKKQYEIDFYEFIESLGLQSFTVTDVTRHLLERYSKEFDKKKNATQFVYRHLKQLSSQGVISAIHAEGGKALVFRWCTESKEDSKLLQLSDHDRNKVNDIIVTKLQEKIRRYKTEMLMSMGETEAYSEWAQEMPDFAEYVKPHYQNTREQAKLMLGKVKGFERLLAEYEARYS